MTANNSLDATTESFYAKSDDKLPVLLRPEVLVVSYVSALASVLIFLSEATAIHILLKCTRIPRHCRHLSISFLLSDAVGAVFYFIHQLAISGFGYFNDFTRNSRISTVGIMTTISFASIAALSLERAVSLKANIKYVESLKMFHAYLAIAMIWLLHGLTLITILAISFHVHCDWKLSDCDFWKATRVTRFTLFGFMLFYDIVLLFSTAISYQIARRHQKQIHAQQLTAFRSQSQNSNPISRNQYVTADAIVKIAAAYVILHAPMTLNVIWTELSENLQSKNFNRSYRLFSYFCIQLGSFINISLYVVKFVECKMHFYRILAKFSSSAEERAERLRYQVFDIVTSIENITQRR